MSANFETGFFVREPAWHGLGTIVQEAPSSREALTLAGLDWNVIQAPVIVKNEEAVGYKANLRDSDNTLLGIVSDKYKIVQNVDAFDFTDSLLGEGVKYETAGSLKNGKTVWLLAKMPETMILGDEFIPYLCFTNTHDGTGAVKVCMTNIRVVCQNTLNVALSTAKRSWSTKHMGDITTKLSEARNTLLLANEYMNKFSDEAESLATQHMSRDEVDSFLDKLFHKDEADSNRKLNNIEEAKETFYICYLAPDLVNFINTKYGVLNAMADMIDHKEPARASQGYRENNFARIINGHALLDETYSRLKAMV